MLTRLLVVLQDAGKTSATASLGLITLWDVEGGLPQIDKYLYSRDNHVVAGNFVIQIHFGCQCWSSKGLQSIWSGLASLLISLHDCNTCHLAYL